MPSYRPDDTDIAKMTECLNGVVIPGGQRRVRCLYIGRNCTRGHIVAIAPLGMEAVAATHEHLDFFSWSTGFPHHSETYVDLDANRVALNFAKLEVARAEDVEYVVVYGDQEHISQQSSGISNRALRAMVKGNYMRWTDDIFVVKVDKATGTLMDTTDDDIPDIAELLKHALVSGDVA